MRGQCSAMDVQTFGAWWAGQTGDRDGGLRSEQVPQLVQQARSAGLLDLPLPGSGRTAARLAALTAWGRADLVFARLAEGHADAVAILAELGGVEPGDDLWGVWAAVPRSVRARREGDGWLLDGDRPWCSGAGVCTRALVTAVDGDDEIRLFAVAVSQGQPLDGTWPAVGMAGSDSRTVRFTAAPAVPVGGPGGYVDRPGFWHGGIGVAACWHGGALGIADALLRAARSRPPDPHALAHLGAVAVTVAATGTLLQHAATVIDADPKQPLPELAATVRLAAEATGTQVMDRVGRALGAGPLCLDHAHARRIADLTVYLRQSHAEADLAGLGAAIRDGAETPW